VFRRDWLATAYAGRHSLTAAITDDAQLVEAAGHAVYVVPGSLANFKITTKDDMELADAVLKARSPKPDPVPQSRAFDDEAKW
jgi:2-C-methyl-D-erythritol 4-phosphate cytidylyltransferase